MLNVNDLKKASLSRDLVADQTDNDVSNLLGSAAFDVTEGYGAASSSSMIVLVHAGGFADQEVTATMKWTAPTVSPNEDVGVLARYITDRSSRTFYYARVDGGLAKISRVVAGVFTTLTQQTYVLPADELATVTLRCVASSLTATFVAATPGTVVLTASDATIPRGCVGFRSLSCAMWCRSFSWKQL